MSRTGTAAGIAAWMAATLVVSGSGVVVVVGWDHLGSSVSEVIEGLLFVSVGPIYSVIAAVIIGRDPRNVVGWMTMLIAFGISYGVVFEVTVPLSAPVDAGVLYLAYLGLGGASWLLFIIPTFHLLLTFPTGQLVSRRWRWLVAVEGALVAYLLFFTVFAREIGPVEIEGAVWTVANPIGFLDESDFNAAVFNAALVVLVLGALASVVIRFIRSRGVERQQLKVLTFSSCLYAAMYVWTGLRPSGEDSVIFNALLWFGVAGIGAGMAVAMLRYRLYDVDRVISRIVAYALVVGLLGLGFLGLVTLVGIQASEEPLFVAGATLGAAAVFNPLRRQILRWFDRRFNRSRYDAERIMDTFARSWRDTVEPGGVVNGWLGVVEETMQPGSVGLRVRS